jgi:hypothetical protein
MANCVGIFCEDIREEVGGTYTIVGVMPDNINIAGQPPAPEVGGTLLMPKLAIYLRVNIETSKKPAGSIAARASIPGLPEIPMGELTAEAIDHAFADSAAKNNPLVGIIFKAAVSPVQLSQSGIASAFVRIGGEEILAATLNIQIATS